MDSHTTHHKIKAEWTRSSTNGTNEELVNKLQEHDKNSPDLKCGKVEILEQIVLRSSNEDSQIVVNKNKNELKQEKIKGRKRTGNKGTDDMKSKKCQVCEKSFPVQNFEEHVKSHSFFECSEPECNKKFKRKSSLRKHMYIHKGKFKYSCPDCDENFIDKCKYQIHIASRHKKIDRVYECKECDKKFTSADYLRKHQITHRDEYPYPCTVCNQKFKWLTSLQTHNMIHTQNRTIVQCNNCSKCFFNQRTLDRHMKIHQNVKYHCKVCNSVVSTRKDNIMRHIRHLHSDIPRVDFSNYIGTTEIQNDEKLGTLYTKNGKSVDEIEITDETDDDDEPNDLIIDESVQEIQEEKEQEIVEIQPPAIINNRVNVIQSIGNPNKNQQQSPQHAAVTADILSTDYTIHHNNNETEKTSINESIIKTSNDNKSNNQQPEKIIDNEIQLPPKKKAIAKYNPIEHYRKILGLSETNTSSTSNESKQSPEQVFPDHWRKRTSQNFLFRR